jgi:DNA-binding NtrC family response regulator/pSer/pThr/pTyr-binding forkhead associated (FHA) protein
VLTIGRSASAEISIHDPLASRRHARLHIGETFAIEDLGSANGTRVRDLPIPSNAPVAVSPGEAVTIGTTCLMVQQARGPAGSRRLLTHARFESRIEEECAHARSAVSTFCLARIRVEHAANWTRVAPVLMHELSAPHVLAMYGPNEYEALLRGVDADAANGILQEIMSKLAQRGYEGQFGTSWFPLDGQSFDALMDRAGAFSRAKDSSPIGDSLESGAAPAMRAIHDIAVRAAPASINILILGETGVGKEVLARAIHRLSPRRDRPLLCVNCAGLTESLVESELFGHERGAFTGAVQAKPGLLETAQGGTVFLDEIGELPIATQAKLLRVIEEREVRRIGSTKTRPIDVRFITATNRDLESDAERGRFRSDLFFRLNGISLAIPPLRERVTEIAGLARSFVKGACEALGRKPLLTISERAMAMLEAYRWPGNIRELRNVMERSVVLCTGFEIGPECLPVEKMRLATDLASVGVSETDRSTILPVSPQTSATEVSSEPDERSWGNDERQRIVDALAASAGNQSRAARLLGMPRRTFVAKLDTYAIPRPQKI